jgi:hypothetical protein
MCDTILVVSLHLEQEVRTDEGEGPLTSRRRWRCGTTRACVARAGDRRLLAGAASLARIFLLLNPSCPLQALNGEGQQEADDLQLKASWRDRVDLLREEVGQLAENRFDVLANRLAQELLPRW